MGRQLCPERQQRSGIRAQAVEQGVGECLRQSVRDPLEGAGRGDLGLSCETKAHWIFCSVRLPSAKTVTVSLHQSHLPFCLLAKHLSLFLAQYSPDHAASRGAAGFQCFLRRPLDLTGLRPLFHKPPGYYESIGSVHH